MGLPLAVISLNFTRKITSLADGVNVEAVKFEMFTAMQVTEPAVDIKFAFQTH